MLVLTVCFNLVPWVSIPAVTGGVGFEPPVFLLVLIPVLWAVAMLLLYRTSRERVVFYLSAFAAVLPGAAVLDQLASAFR